MTWTAAIMPDDALDPDSLVGRMLRPTIKESLTVEKPLPLWRRIAVAGISGPCNQRDIVAAEIEALRDWLLQGDGEVLRNTLIEKGWVTNFNANTLVRLIRQHYAALFTEQASIARQPP